jgi:hypothetical protein
VAGPGYEGAIVSAEALLAGDPRHADEGSLVVDTNRAESSAGEKGLWYQGVLVVSGGGDQFFRVSSDVRTKHFSGLQVNAPE